MTEQELEAKAREAKNTYMREWRAKNKDKVKANNQRYWAKKADQTKQSTDEQQKE